MAFETPFVPGGLHFYFGPSGVKITWNEVPLRKPYQGISGYSQIKIFIFENLTKKVKKRQFQKIVEDLSIFEKSARIKIWDVY